MTGRLFGQVAKVLKEFAELRKGQEIFVGLDEKLFRFPVLYTWFRVQFLVVSVH